MTLDGPERGLLCLRVRDEIRMTIDAYKTLYDSSVTFGIKKQLQAEQGMAEMEEQVTLILQVLWGSERGELLVLENMRSMSKSVAVSRSDFVSKTFE